MATNNTITLNAVTLKPTGMDIEEQFIGESTRMANATLRKVQKGIKNKWTLSWSGLIETQIAAIRTLYRNTSSMTFVDEFGTSYTVATTGFRTTFNAGDMSFSSVKYYDVELTFEEV